MRWTWNWVQKRSMKRVEVEAVNVGRRRPVPWRKTGAVAVAMAPSSGVWSGWDTSGSLCLVWVMSAEGLLCANFCLGFQ